ncbi:MAG: PAS domain S-box protein [Methanoregula sp.]|nr:PAS domain S-box protein [Methanoregula sp.]
MVTKKKNTAVEKSMGASQSTSSLHDAAEKKLARSPSVSHEMKGQTAEELIHELQVHQIELETQADELIRAQLALTESRDQYLDLYEFAPLGYLTLTDTALISRANLTAAGLFCVERTRLINARFRKLIVPEDLETWDRYFTNLLQSEEKLTATLVLKRGNGATFPARLESIRLHGNSGGQLIRIAISDISDIRKVEKELRTSEERFRLALKNAPVSVAVQDKNLVFQWAYNQSTIRPEDVRGKKDIDLFTPDDAARLIELKRKVFETGKEVREKIWLTMNGKRSYLDLYLEPQRDDIGQITGIGVATVDMTEQKLADDALRQNEENLLRAQELLEAVTKGTDVIIAAQDVNFRYTFFNQAYKEEIRRLTGKDLTLGTSMVDLFAEIPEEQKMAMKEWSKVLNGENVNQIVEFGDTDNPRRVYHVLHTPIRDSQGNIVGAGEVAYDITKQVQVEDKLRETKDYLDNLITYANAPIIVWDPQFRITLFNQAFENLTGRNAQEVLGQNFDILLPDTYLPPAMDLIRKTMEGERWESVEIPILHKNGEIRTVLWNTSAIFGHDGKTIVSTIAQGQDITDRKKIESEHWLRAVEYKKMNVTLNEEIRQRNISDTMLKKTLSLLNASLESTADGIYAVDQQGMITSYNHNFMNMWKIPLALLETGKNETVVNHVLSQLKNPEGFLSSIQELEDHPGRESFDTIEFNDGKIFERYSKSQKIGDSAVGRVWSFRDVTERKLSEEAQVASEIRYRRLFETAQDGILILDAETGQIVEVNPFLITMLGFSRDQFLGKKLWEIGLFKDIVANKENFEELQRKEYVRYEDMPIETADGQRIAVEFLSNVYTVNNKKVIQCNIRDITVRKKLEEDLVVKAAELARSNIELQQFAYIASHDLQEPLRAISGFTELLVKRYHGKIDEKADTYIDFITEGTTRMQQMIQDLLTYSRVQTQVHEFVLIDSNTSFDLAISDLQVATKEHNAVITKDLLPSIYADREQITKMFQNLISNAIKFNKPGVVPNVHISAKQDVNNWIFSVSDNGIGIDQQYADRIFKIFQRLHTRDEYPGTGIGLAICKRIAEQHGGTIWIESVPGSGSTFYFTIPKRKKETNHD